jgi:acetyl-CoA C-acetyltransferase
VPTVTGVTRSTPEPRTPVIIGVGQALQRTDDPTTAIDATELMAQAIGRAADDADAQRSPLDSLDVLAVVNTLSWRYGDPCRVLADRLAVSPRTRVVTPMGGNSPQSLVNAAAAAIASGDLDLAVLAGGETWRTRMRARRLGTTLTWPKVDPDLLAAEPPTTWGHDLTMNSPAEEELGLIMPVQVYPMFETALRAARRSEGVGPEEHLRQVGRLWSRFSEVAARNPHAWIRRAMTTEEVITPGDRNRMVGLPYTKVMNSNNDVDQAAAVIICSVDRARALGVPEDRWVFPHSGADCHEHPFISEREHFHTTPAVAAGGRLALELAGLAIDDIAHLDLYSCFPSAVQLGARSLGLDPFATDRELTLTGGLSFAGGPWNNYVMHAIATLVGRLREDPGSAGLVWANGGYVTKHAFGVYSSEPPSAGFRRGNPQEQVDALPRRTMAGTAEAVAAGTGTIESYTVMHDREGRPETAWASLLLPDGRRAWGRSTRPEVVAHLLDGEHVGETVRPLPDHDLEPA